VRLKHLGEFGVLMVSDGTTRPYRLKIKSPDYASLPDTLGRGHYIAEDVVILGRCFFIDR
jgi:NADH-quinone oxidoreductase subunit D